MNFFVHNLKIQEKTSTQKAIMDRFFECFYKLIMCQVSIYVRCSDREIFTPKFQHIFRRIRLK